MYRSTYIFNHAPEEDRIGFSFSSPPAFLECFFRILEVKIKCKHIVEIIFKKLDIRLCPKRIWNFKVD